MQNSDGVDESNGFGAGFVPSYGNYVGPGHPANTKHEKEPVDAFDRVAELHDFCYEAGIDRKDCDGAMANDLAKIPEPVGLYGQLYMKAADMWMDMVGSDHKLSLEDLIEKSRGARLPEAIVRRELRRTGITGREQKVLQKEIMELVKTAPLVEEVRTPAPLPAPKIDASVDGKSWADLVEEELEEIEELPARIAIPVKEKTKRERKRRRHQNIEYENSGGKKKKASKTWKKNEKVLRELARKSGSNAFGAHPPRRNPKGHKKFMKGQAKRMAGRNKGAKAHLISRIKKLVGNWRVESSRPGCVRLTGSDLLYIYSTTSAVTTIGNVITTADLNPLSSAWANTRLKQFAPLFQKFKFEKCVFRYTPAVGETTNGQFCAYVSSDANSDLSSLAGTTAAIQVVLAQQGHREWQSADEMTVALPTPKTDKEYYMAPAGGGVTTDKRLYAQGKLHFLNMAALGASTTFGSIEVDYVVELIDASLQTDLIAANNVSTNASTDAKSEASVCAMVSQKGTISMVTKSTPTFQYLFGGAQNVDLYWGYDTLQTSYQKSLDMYSPVASQVYFEYQQVDDTFHVHHWPLDHMCLQLSFLLYKSGGTINTFTTSSHSFTWNISTLAGDSITIDNQSNMVMGNSGDAVCGTAMVCFHGMTPGTPVYLSCTDDLGSVPNVATVNWAVNICACGINKKGKNPYNPGPLQDDEAMRKCRFQEVDECSHESTHLAGRSWDEDNNCYKLGIPQSCKYCSEKMKGLAERRKKEAEEKVVEESHSIVHLLEGLLSKKRKQEKKQKQKSDPTVALEELEQLRKEQKREQEKLKRILKLQEQIEEEQKKMSLKIQDLDAEPSEKKKEEDSEEEPDPDKDWELPEMERRIPRELYDELVRAGYTIVSDSSGVSLCRASSAFSAP